MMDYVDTRCYKLNKRLLSMVCLWPYQASRYTRILRVFIDILLVQLVVCQLLAFVRRRFTLSVLLQILPILAVLCIYPLKYTTFLLTLENMRELIEKIRCDWIAITCHEEHKILEQFADHGRLLGLLIAYAFYAVWIGFIVSGVAPEICDVIMPLNESRARQLPLVAEFFVNQDKYRYPLLLQINITVFLGVTTLISTESITATISAHGCGLLKITQYRIQNILFNVPSAQCACDQRDKIICRRIIHAVHVYQKALEFFDLVMSLISAPYFVFLLLGVLGSTLNLYGFSQALSVSKKIEEIVYFAVMILAQFSYMFCSNYMAQRVTDHNAEVAMHLCDLQWYKFPLPAQKLLLLFMKNASRNCRILLGGVFVASMQGFSTISQMSFSYFMVIYSRQ